jgi:hypothetical protein
MAINLLRENLTSNPYAKLPTCFHQTPHATLHSGSHQPEGRATLTLSDYHKNKILQKTTFAISVHAMSS